MAMATSNLVKITEVCRVKPAPNPSEKTISSEINNYFPLTFFDTMWLRFPPTQRIFFYEIHHLSSHHFHNTIVHNLKHSLSLTLQHYPSLAGKLTWHPETANPVIRYATDDDDDDGGVFLSIAESYADFDSISTDDFKEAQNLHPLLPDLHVSESEADVLSLQLTLFSGYGFSIGFCAHHASMDGKSTAMFIKSWVLICRLGGGVLTPELMPNLETRSILMNDPLKLSTIFIDHWMKMKTMDGNENQVRNLLPMVKKPPAAAAAVLKRTFRLTPEQVGKIKVKLIKSSVSSFTAVCAYIWTCLVKAEKGDIRKEDVYLNINVDCRGRWEPPVPENYFGNCVTYRFAKVKVESLEGGDGVAAAAAAISEAIGSLSNGGVLKGAEKWLSEVSRTFRNEKVYGIGGSTWFDLYGADFGWGRPKKVEMVSIDRNGSFSLCDGRDGNGVIEIGIVMTKEKIEAFASIFAQQLSN